MEITLNAADAIVEAYKNSIIGCACIPGSRSVRMARALKFC